MKRTVVPRHDKDRERASTGSGPVTSRFMSPEELEDYRTRTGYKAPTEKAGNQKDGGVKQRLAAAEEERRQEAEKVRQEKFDGRSSTNEPDKQEFLQWIAEGKSIAAFERQLGMRTNSMYYLLKKWELAGIKPGKARELLGLDCPPPQQEVIPVTVTETVTHEGAVENLHGLIAEQRSLAEAYWKENQVLLAEVEDKRRNIQDLREDLINWKSLAQKREIELNELKQAFVELTEERDLLLAVIDGEAERIELSRDTVNHPAHYTAGGIETIDFIRAKLSDNEFAGYCKGNVLKYVSRATHKGGIEDLRKAGKYIEFATAGGRL